MPMNILLAGSFDDEAEHRQWAAALDAALRPALPGGHRLLSARGEVPDETIAAAIVANPPPGSLQGLPQLRLIQSLWAGVDRLLADATLPPGVPVARMVDPMMNEAMAETALWAVLALHRGFFTYARQQAAGRWQPLAQRRADELPVLVLGAGQMGGTVARRLAANGYPVTVWRRQAPAAGAGQAAVNAVHEVHGPDGLGTALAGAQVLLNLLPLTPETRGLINARLLAALPRGAGLVNLARGAHVLDADLLAALDAGQIGHAVLDVFSTEPLPADHRYWQHPQVSVLPHAAAMTDARTAAAIAAANIAALAAGRPIANLVQRATGY
ncbi:2-hydroxyacid dehydrogenase [Aquabacterium sp. OR-4]|uniref:2-hydroxyacid dehydrogenase n=1 Tax=Aquabacterium sp. OR-4 TaxID=2978127 RepID=UPI0028CA9018|nr:glyoxylate/hydroxypyruvate reductase A [Aquabacterium sp. OR-4]MDT7833881.1 glyoxylate/hydroxypyruvate reductase A [Aquabacterium sp. OR-4]